MKWIFLSGAIIGAILPLTFLGLFLAANGFDASAFLRQMFQNHISSMFAMDVLVSAVVFWTFIFAEGRKLRTRKLWAYVLCTLLVGVSLALPLCLFFRERKLYGAQTRS